MTKTRRNRKWKILHTVFERRTLCFRSRKNRRSKVKLWWVGTRERKTRAFFCAVYFFRRKRLCVCFISVYSVLNTLSEYTFTYQKTLLHTILLLVFKIVESFQYILKLKFDRWVSSVYVLLSTKSGFLYFNEAVVVFTTLLWR